MNRLLIALIVTAAAYAQAPPFAISVQQGSAVNTVSDGATVTVAAPAVGVTQSVLVALTFQGSGTAVLNTAVLTGSGDFSLTAGELPLRLATGDRAQFTVRVTPSSSVSRAAQLTLNYSQDTTAGTVTVKFISTAPDLLVSYIPQPDGNATVVAPGGNIQFPTTTIGANSSVIVVVTNRGTASGAVSAVGVGGANYQLSGLPLLPATVASGSDLRFNVRFAPTQIGPASGTLQIDLPTGRAAFGLTGSGSGSVFSYQLTQGSNSSALTPGQPIAMPDTQVGQSATVRISLRNSGNESGQIQTIAVQGSGFTLPDLPFLPATIPPAATLTFQVAFSPTQPGPSTGRLRIGEAQFDLTGTGLGPLLTYAFTVGSVSTTISPGGTLTFSPTAVGQTLSARFSVRNTGTAEGTVSNIGLSDQNSSFRVADVPSLPARLSPGAELAFTVLFAPDRSGALSSGLRIDVQTFVLSGTGGPPPSLPAFSLSGPSGPVEPSSQPAVSLALSAPYPLDITGSLTLGFESDAFTSDPALLFTTGGKTVIFRIPANSTDAIFSTGSTQIRFQTGTVAGTISVIPAFATTGGFDITPPSVSKLSMTVAASAPRIVSIQATASSGNSVTLAVTGFSTPRSVTRMTFVFTPVAALNLQPITVTIDSASAFNSWYQSTQSQAFGSQFSATVQFNLSGSVPATATLTQSLDSVSATLTNSLGTSAGANMRF